MQPSVDVLSAYFNGAAAMLGKAAMKICQSAPRTEGECRDFRDDGGEWGSSRRRVDTVQTSRLTLNRGEDARGATARITGWIDNGRGRDADF